MRAAAVVKVEVVLKSWRATQSVVRAVKRALGRALRTLAQQKASRTKEGHLVAEIKPFYPKGEGRGRPPIGLERMLRMTIAQQGFGFCDEGAEEAIYDSQAI